jgi:hypothetical protein
MEGFTYDLTAELLMVSVAVGDVASGPLAERVDRVYVPIEVDEPGPLRAALTQAVRLAEAEVRQRL